MARYRFLLKPRWLLLHVAAAAFAVLLFNLGLWQLRRLDEKQAFNRLYEERAQLPAEPGTELLPPPGSALDAPEVEAVRYRLVQLSGRYREGDEVLIRSRSFQGQPGAYVMTPLDLGDGTAVLINRGWFGASGLPVRSPDAAPPAGPVSLVGMAVAGDVRGSFGPRDPAEGHLATLARADLGRIQAQLDMALYPLVVQLRSQDPPPAEALTLLPPPELGEGPHRGYAVQWFTFTVIGVAGYPLLLRRRARARDDAEIDAEIDPAEIGEALAAGGDGGENAAPAAVEPRDGARVGPG